MACWGESIAVFLFLFPLLDGVSFLFDVGEDPVTLHPIRLLYRNRGVGVCNYRPVMGGQPSRCGGWGDGEGGE